MEVGAVLNSPGFEEETVIGGLWEVGHVEVERKTGLDGSVKMHGCRNPVTRKKRSETKTQNSFEVLAEDMVEIGVVSHDGVQEKFGQITIDSGAAESVMPKNFLPGLAIEPASGMKGQAKYVAANGSRMGNYGQKKVPLRTNMGGNKQAITFQVTDVTKPLAAVSRIVEKGNVVQFGPKAEDNFIRNSAGSKIPIRQERGTYVIDVQYDESAVFTRQA